MSQILPMGGHILKYHKFAILGDPLNYISGLYGQTICFERGPPLYSIAPPLDETF